MTYNEIIKALECCKIGNCDDCPFYGIKEDCEVELPEEGLDLINRQKAEIERLKDENKSIRYCYEQAKSYNDTLAESCEKNCKKFNMTTRAEAIKEFAERLKLKLQWDTEFENMIVFDTDIDNILKEMMEVNENEQNTTI